MRVLRFAALLAGIVCVASFVMFFVSLFQKAWTEAVGYFSGYLAAMSVVLLLMYLDVKIHLRRSLPSTDM